MRFMRQRVVWFVATVLLAALGTAPSRADPLPDAISLVQCKTDFPGSSQVVTDPFGCSLGGGGALSSFANIVEAPFVTLFGEVSAFGFPVNAVGASLTGSLEYAFHLTGGHVGDIVPIFVTANLVTLGDDPDHSRAQASLHVGNVVGLGVTVSACTAGVNCSGGEEFHGTFSVLMQSGGPNAIVDIQVSAFAGSSLLNEFASVFADPYIYVDPSFPDAALYTITVSPGVANVPAVPEPAAAALLALGLALIGRRRLRER